MRTWERAKLPTLCGGCGAQIARGEPMLLLTWVGLRRAKQRCTACAAAGGEGIVPELDDLDPPGMNQKIATFARLDRLTASTKLLHDARLRQAGREPGEDDA